MPAETISLYQWLADAVLLLHAGVVLFVVGGLVLIVLGNLRGWRWVNGWSLRAAHIGAIAFVAVQAWLGMTCPLTTLEMWLRTQAGTGAYGESFIEHWVARLLYHQAPGWVFALVYTGFGALVAVVWWCFPPAARVNSGPKLPAA